MWSSLSTRKAVGLSDWLRKPKTTYKKTTNRIRNGNGISLVRRLAAKEIVVSTMAVLSDSGTEDTNLVGKLQNPTYTQGDRTGEKVYTLLVTYTLMIFILLYFPCIAAVTV